MHTSVLLAVLPAVLASTNNLLLASRQLDCGLGYETCGDTCIPTGYICCDDNSGGCPATMECTDDPSGTTACCVIPGQCSSDIDFISVTTWDPSLVGGVDGGESGVTITDSASLAEFTEAHQDDDSDDDDTPAATTAASDDDDDDDDAASPTGSTGGAPIMTEAAGLAMAFGVGVAMIL